MQNDYDYDLAKEFKRASKEHMVEVCVRALVYEMEKEAQEGIHIPVFLVRDKIEQEAVAQISQAIKTHTIQELYDKCWDMAVRENLVV